jgi:ankyrin repeat protein
VNVLLEGGADVNYRSAYNGRIPLHLACQEGHESVVKVLLESGADVDVADICRKTPLHFACQEGHESVIKMLVENGADIDVADFCRMTPLHFACQEGHESVVKVLVESGADTHARDGEGRLPIDLIEDDRCRGIYKEAEAKLESQALKPVLK